MQKLKSGLSLIKYSLVFVFIIGIFCSCDKTGEYVMPPKYDGWYMAGSSPTGYNIGKTGEEHDGKPVYFITCVNAMDTGFGTIMTNDLPWSALSNHARLTGWIKSEKMYGSAGMWMRVDGNDYTTGKSGVRFAFDNMEDRPIKDNTDWRKYEIVLDVPQDSRKIYYGVWLRGLGQILISDFKIETVGKDVPVTGGK